MENIKPYYRTKNKHFYKKDGKKFFVERKDKGIYELGGEILFDTSIPISFDNKAIIPKIDIKIYK